MSDETKITEEHHLQVAFIRNSPIALVSVKINGVETAAIANIDELPDGSRDIHPIAILCNEEIFKMLTPPNPEDKIIIEREDEIPRSE